MSTTLISLDQYLHEFWEPDREFVDGEVVERNMGEKDHAAWQAALLDLLRTWRESAHIRVFPELRLQTTPTHFRIPNLMVIDRDAPNEQIITPCSIAVRRNSLPRRPLWKNGGED